MSALQITARLSRDAVARTTAAGDAVLIVEVLLPVPAGAAPRIARGSMAYGRGFAAQHACRARAARLRQGVRVQLHAGAIDVRRGRVLLEDIDMLVERDMQSWHPNEPRGAGA
ncbi:MAG: hypothetical protein MUF08_03140 [Burkholderiaceae bacterium]|jgi:hypothetical protein|nr:hypothetical protein [Burkholderiaceae bacterium]MCU0964058.1 hypothetical protein [Burkholderiaceae bacterium]